MALWSQVDDVLCCRYDTYKLQRLHQKKLDRQEAIMEKEMFVGKMMRSGVGNPFSIKTWLKLCMNHFVLADKVPFGEVAMAPPSLNIKPKKAQAKSPVSCCVSLSW